MENKNTQIRNVEADPISRYRTELMGVAIILLMFSHSNVFIPVNVLSNSYHTVKNIGQVGVDIFFFLSGMGCYYSFQKCVNVVSFYIRRILRIFPTYLLIVPVRIIVDSAVDGYTIPSAIRRYSLVSFFLDGALVTWFLAGLFLLYILFPVMYAVLNKSRRTFLWVILLYAVGICLIPYLKNKGIAIPGFLGRDIFIVRILPFMTGAYYARKVDDGLSLQEETLTKYVDFLLIALVHLFMLCVLNRKFNTWNMWLTMRMLFLPLSVIIMLCVTLIFRKRSFPALTRLGKITLELYLLHEWILYISDKLIFKYVNKTFFASFLLNVVVVLWAILIAETVNKIVGSICRRIRA